MEQIKEKIFTCPHCRKQLFQKNNTHLSPLEPEYKHMIQGAYAFNDGDRVPVDLSRFAEDEDMQLDHALIVGKCGFCTGEYYAVEIYIASRPVMLDSPFIFTNLNRDKGKQELFKIEDNHLLLRYKDCSFVEENSSEPLTVNHHLVGLFPLYETISSDIGVSYHHGGKIWEEASKIIVSIMENHSFISKVCKKEED
ncbi:hypothetical protein ABD87_14960 [Lysinibacillus sphaericus]|uniref:hypothetical protein n=1 Tax=Lysinibacillus sphaericus TaxID=1421 RepID=UPI0018CC8FE6|nr:hypothetical protein [Lysinibacillus sphaericus]MBG9730793.1 hypothetical protein [Lysinibacillus sphaericus]